MKKFQIFVFALFLLATSIVSAQTYDVYIANRRLTSPRSMEFDVYIKSTGSTAPWAMRLYQAGYRFGTGFVNGGILSASYVTGSSELESSFGKTWGFSYNATQRVINQSSNIGSSCPGAIIKNLPRRIGTFRISNTVNFGCTDDSMSYVTAGSGVLSLSIGKYATVDCSSAYASLITSGARPFTDTPGTKLKGRSDIRIVADSATVCLSASGGLPPYTGIGCFKTGAGNKSFRITDSRGCVVMLYDTIRISPPISSKLHSAETPSGLIRPNPSRGIIFLETPDFRPELLRIYDLNGRLVFRSRWNNVLNISHLKQGTYLLRIEGRGHSVTQRLVLSE
jgi:hypothetical protein